MVASVEDPEVFAEIFERHAEAMYRFLSRRLGEVADDALSECFLAAFRRREAYRAEHPDARPWLYGIATNIVRRHRREELSRLQLLARAHGRAGNVADPAERVVEQMDAARIRPALAAALARLAPRDRDVLLLHAWEELTYLQISAVLSVPVGTVRSRLHRTRRLLRQDLSDLDLMRVASTPTNSSRRTHDEL
ncbi:RNA polymerase sigma factor [uncultured Serinicoccus sp.]|uniref:RNA polymerase sigma factor n=1 Tax=uncultured Serinicoccus sp. TaxID=735514 RepID=UPI00262F49F7|nr:sigma-70 family RNA polymerase sigma factor [uncultured Serinicoccus sp.]